MNTLGINHEPQGIHDTQKIKKVTSDDRTRYDLEGESICWSISKAHPHHNNPFKSITVKPPTTVATPNAGTRCFWAPFPLLFSLVLPNILSIPECPFDVASTAESTVTVLRVFVCAVVGNVWVASAVPSTGANARNTSATPGAGTWIVQTPLLHGTACTDRVPDRRPSDSKLLPNVWPAQVKFPFCETLDARRYLNRDSID